MPSISAYSKSGTSDNRSKARSKTPALAQRLKRTKMLFQLPKSTGRSRQGEPVRTRQSTASRNSLLSLPVAPGSDFLPGNTGSTFAQAASLNTKRERSNIPQASPTESLNHNPNGMRILSVNRA